MFSYSKTNSDHPDFQLLARRLEEELMILDGNDHAFYAQLNKGDNIKYTIVAYDNGQPAGCGAIRPCSEDAMEIKRMYTIPEKRGLGIASQILSDLEDWTLHLNYKKCVLETGRNQPAAIAFYKKHNYSQISNFGRYKDSENSLCFEKKLTPGSTR